MSKSVKLSEFLRTSWEAFNHVLPGKTNILGRTQLPLSPSNSINDWKITASARN
jgi:hypothetical protein